MAYVKDRVRRDGSVYYTAMWRAGGTAGGKQESEVFDEEPAAQRFKDLVNGHGQNWPPGWIRGQGFVAERRRAETMFEPFALAYIDRLTGIQGDTHPHQARPAQRDHPVRRRCRNVTARFQPVRQDPSASARLHRG
ncbi:hypothetical protein [Streptomyces sp. TRM72054]|uniref:hypothetical protein n=1 Tax=Streptomyces sp. TRM72054 TaxID=2870562 RepID=UPI0021AB34EB|nr:hypothetical protein [Streptomyces sp. TRM72054]